MISIQFSTKVKERYDAIQSGEKEGLTNKEEMGTLVEQILTLISEYEASKVVLSEQEYEHEKLELEYDNQFPIIKEKYMNDGYKSTEAKEHTKRDLAEQRFKILEVERDINLLKTNIHSVEYQLRLKYLQLENTNKFKPDIQDILEAR